MRSISTPISGMLPHSKLRSLLSFSLILVIHLAILFALNWKHRSPPPQETRLGTMWIIPEPKLRKPEAVEKIATKIASVKPKSITIVEQSSTPSEPQPISAPLPDKEPTPHLDLDALRAQAVQQELGRERSPIELQNEASRKKHGLEARMEEGANEAQRADCRTAHSGAGLFAPLMIAADLIRDKGCKF